MVEAVEALGVLGHGTIGSCVDGHDPGVSLEHEVSTVSVRGRPSQPSEWHNQPIHSDKQVCEDQAPGGVPKSVTDLPTVADME